MLFLVNTIDECGHLQKKKTAENPTVFTFKIHKRQGYPEFKNISLDKKTKANSCNPVFYVYSIYTLTELRKPLISCIVTT